MAHSAELGIMVADGLDEDILLESGGFRGTEGYAKVAGGKFAQPVAFLVLSFGKQRYGPAIGKPLRSLAEGGIVALHRRRSVHL